MARCISTVHVQDDRLFVCLFALCCTFIDTVAETTLVAATSVNKLHVGTHVGLASVTADWACLAMVHHV